MTPGARRLVVWLSLAAGLTAAGSTAHARTAVVVPYPSGDVWPSTIRFLRVDNDYAIKEKDEPSGYVLFELLENKRVYRAALEMVKTSDAEGRAATQIVCTIQELPRRYETSLLGKLTAKVRDERGPPAPPPARKPSPGNAPPTRDPPKDPSSEGRSEGKAEGKAEPRPPGDLSGLPGPPMWGPPAAP